MLNRRAFLLASAAAATTVLSGCGSKGQNTLDITLLQGTIPLQLIGDFKKVIKQKQIGELNLHPEAQLKAIFELLKAWQKTDTDKSPSFIDSLPIVGKSKIDRAGITTLGDSWLQKAVADKLIQPVDTSKLSQWSSLPQTWQNLVKRDEKGIQNNQGKVYGVPYRWGNTLIAYRKDKVTQDVADWSDLWREEFTGRISVIDEYREIIGLTLKKLGHSYNTQDLSQVTNLEQELQQLHKQIKFYSSDKYLQPLVLGDAWLAVGWSNDILNLTKRYPDIKIVVPASGTSLWADLWVQPQNQEQTDNAVKANLLNEWIDFCWQQRSARQILLFTKAISPIFTGTIDSEISSDLENNPILKSSIDTFDKSEFLLPLSNEAEEQYLNLWKQIREVRG